MTLEARVRHYRAMLDGSGYRIIHTDAYDNRVDGWAAVIITVAGLRLACESHQRRRVQWSVGFRGRHWWNMTWWRR